MKRLPRTRHAGALAWLALIPLAFAGCAESSVQGLDGAAGSDLAFAPQGGGGPGPKVDSVDPPSGPQGATLDVTVRGSGYDETSEVTLLLNRKATGKILTNSTAFVSSEELVANITIAADAQVDLYDVEVTAQRGRKKGIGIESFEVTEYPGGSGTVDNVRHQTEFTLTDRPADGVRSDGAGLYTPFGALWDKADGTQDLWNVFVEDHAGNERRIHLVIPSLGVDEVCQYGRLYLNIGASPDQWYNDLGVGEQATTAGTFECLAGKGKNVSGWTGEWGQCIAIEKMTADAQGRPRWRFTADPGCPAAVAPVYRGVPQEPAEDHDVLFSTVVTELN